MLLFSNRLGAVPVLQSVLTIKRLPGFPFRVYRMWLSRATGEEDVTQESRGEICALGARLSGWGSAHTRVGCESDPSLDSVFCA